MDFCILASGSTLAGFRKDYSFTDIKDSVQLYLDHCKELGMEPSKTLKVDLYKYNPFDEYRKGLILEDFIESLDETHKEEFTSLSEFPDEVFELESKLYELIKKNYTRYWGQVFATIEIDLTSEEDSKVPVYSVSAVELSKDLKLMSFYNKIFSNYETAEKYVYHCFEKEGYSNIEKCVSDQNGDFTITTFTGTRSEMLESKMVIEILQEEPAETFEP